MSLYQKRLRRAGSGGETDRDSMDMDWFLEELRDMNKRQSTIARIANVTPAMLQDAVDYVSNMRVKYKLSYNNGILVVKGTSQIHSAASAFYILKVGSYNTSMTTTDMYPVSPGTDGKVDLGLRGYCEPDAQFMVEGRQDESPNVVVEVNFRGDTISNFIGKGVDYINDTSNVMSVILIDMFVHRHDHPGSPRVMSMIICEVRRTVPRPAGPPYHTFESLVSFGNHDVRPLALNHWTASTGLAFSGVGFVQPNGQDYPLCDRRGINHYLFEIPGDRLLCLDNDLQVLFDPVNYGLPALPGNTAFVVDLFHLQMKVTNAPGTEP